MRVILAGGCFDIIHFGHISFLKEAKSHGDRLVVALESDGNVHRRKGKNRPIHTQLQRKAMLEALSCVDEVIALPLMTHDDEYFNMITRVHPTIIAVTENDPCLDHKKKQAALAGAQIVIIPKVHTPSTSQLAKLLGLE